MTFWLGKARERWRMGLYKRGKKWTICYTVDGKQHCESTGTNNKQLAQKILDIRRAEIVEGRFIALLKSNSPSFKDYLSTYLASRKDLHPHTRSRYEVSRRSLERFFGDARLSEITDRRIEDYKVARLNGKTGPVGVNRDLSLLRLVLKQAKKERYIAHSPLENRDHFLNERRNRIQARPFTIDEEQRILSAAQGYLRPLILLLLDTGLRPNAEGLPLKWRNVDFERGMVTVIASKTSAGLRTVPMTVRLKTELLRWKEVAGPKNSEFVFFHPRNPAKHLLHVPKTWARALKNADVPKRRLYDCRSTYCSRMYAAGIQPILIELLMGHASKLAHVYAKADDDFKRDAAAKLEALIDSKASVESGLTATTWVN